MKLGNFAPECLDFGNCLIDPESKQVLAVDPQAAQLLDINPSHLEKYSLNKLFPDLTLEQWTEIFALSDMSKPVILNLNIPTTKAIQTVELRASKLINPDKALLLLTICPHSSPPPQQFQCDALTGLPDRRQLVHHHSKLRNSASNKSSALALLFLDIDDFKSINDQYGHATGDHILRTLASRWQECLREEDLVARYGGDEFIVLLAGIVSQQDTNPVVARLSAATSEPIQHGEKQFIITVTIGIALSKGSSTPIEELIATADRNMYAAKAKQ